MRAKKVDQNQPRIAQPARRYHYVIGIDPGVVTGYAVKNTIEGKYTDVESNSILTVQEFVLMMHELYNVFVRVEDARLRKWFGKTSREVLQGAGSIKRDCQIWEEFLTKHNIPHEFVAPKDNKTKLDSKKFALFTGWKGKTNEHGRDSAMLIIGY